MLRTFTARSAIAGDETGSVGPRPDAIWTHWHFLDPSKQTGFNSPALLDGLQECPNTAKTGQIKPTPGQAIYSPAEPVFVLKFTSVISQICRNSAVGRFSF